jgi:hypothetical protein
LSIHSNPPASSERESAPGEGALRSRGVGRNNTRRHNMDEIRKTFEGAGGNKIEEGMWIAYPVRQSSSMWMRIGRVIGIEQEVVERWGGEPRTATKVRIKVYDQHWHSGAVRTYMTWVSRIERVVQTVPPKFYWDHPDSRE